MAVARNGKLAIIPNSAGERVTPSVVALSTDGSELLIGTPAKRQATINPQNTLFSIKRLVGRRFTEPVIQNDLRLLPYETRSAQSGIIEVLLGGKWFSPQEALAFIIGKLKRDAETFLEEPVERAVITVPAYYSDPQRKGICEAGQLAGLEVLRIINEPTAACLAYGYHNREKNNNILIYHLGGGTLDVSVVETGEGVFRVKSTSGDNHLGGDDFDQRVINWIIETFIEQEDIDIQGNHQALARVREASEKAKIELSSTKQTEIDLPYFAKKDGKYVNLKLLLTREKLEQLVSDLVTQTLGPCKQAMKDANLTTSEIDKIFLVGQQTHMPAIIQAVETFFKRSSCQGVDPAEAVALGAALQGGILNGELSDILLVDVTPFTLSVEILGSVASPVIYRNTMIPTHASQIFSPTRAKQSQVDIKILQGERPMATDNTFLGQLNLYGIPPPQEGTSQIEVNFDIDVNGILTVSAVDKSLNRVQKISIGPLVERLAERKQDDSIFQKKSAFSPEPIRKEMSPDTEDGSSFLNQLNTFLHRLGLRFSSLHLRLPFRSPISPEKSVDNNPSPPTESSE
jgi:molecular chaperone DnaK